MKRAKAAHRNWTENAVLLGLSFGILFASGSPSTTAPTLVHVAVAARYIHSISYLLGIGGVRTVGYMVALGCGISIAWIGLSHVL
eukprot:CAMPEP_0167797228 /NCGR_PEP_ID=MMETSP0111_2-20121227/15521_1 /TAXON_ID=91324 /ORGANISM="Lotharella globosa, Strain CCCM811" /LENGTH=84 /DNA_ID=CAMNT_0007691277 /DNA_START=312 /DNA_END=566 /DNA_ORIENTATION=+